MTKRTRGAKSPMNNLRHLFTIAAVLLLMSVLIAPVAADATVSTVDELENAVKTGGTITLGSDIVLTKPLTIADGQEITIIGDGHTITRGVSGFLFTVTNGKLTLGDGTSVLVIHGNDTSYRATNTGDMQNTKSLVLLSGAKANLVMNDKVTLRNNSISDINNRATWSPETTGGDRAGGAVQVIYGAQFTMNGGEIIYNDACAGGAVFTRFVGDDNQQTKFIMNNGRISYNTAVNASDQHADGGGIFVGNKNSKSEGLTDSVYDAIFEMKDGEISYNKAVNVGGGIKSQGTVIISGGKIIGNEAAEGAGIVISGSDGINGNVWPSTTLSGGMVEGNIVIPATTDTDNCGGVISVQCPLKFEISGDFTLADNQDLLLNYFRDADTTGLLITDPFTGKIPLSLFNGRGEQFKAEQLIFTIADTVNQKAEDLIDRLVLVDQTVWTLSAKGDKQIVLAYNTPKALIGEPYAYIEWINSTIANVTITLDLKANDATTVKVYLNETGAGLGIPVTKTGTFPKGSSISDLQFTDLDPTKTYSVVAVLENENVKDRVYTTVIVISHTDVVLQNQKPPMPANVVITGAGGAVIPDNKITLVKDGNVTLSVNVTDNDGNILKNEYVTWELTDSSGNVTLEGYNHADKTLTVKVNGTQEGTATLKAKAVHETDVYSAPLTITVVENEPDLQIQFTQSGQQIVRGISDIVELTPMATDGSNNYFGQEITWKIDPSTGITRDGGDKSGETATFTATVAGMYTVTANLTSDQTKTTSVQLIFIGNPSIDGQPVGAIYTQTAQATALSVTASNPSQGTSSLSYQWYSSTDANFGVDVTEITGATGATYKPSTETVGTMYYRVEVSYTQDGHTTNVDSDAVAIVVVEPTADVITLSPAGTAYTLYVGGSGQTIVATAKNTSVNKNIPGIIWSKASDDAVKISPNGNTVVITPVHEGTAVITASVGNKEQKVTITVKPASDAPKDTGGSSSSGSSVWLTETSTETPTPTPTETAQPTDTVPTDIPVTQPTATPETPGFGVLAVLAGLGAVAVLRRR